MYVVLCSRHVDPLQRFVWCMLYLFTILSLGNLFYDSTFSAHALAAVVDEWIPQLVQQKQPVSAHVLRLDSPQLWAPLPYSS